VFGEQVEAAIGHGWLDLIQDDLEGEDYAIAAFGLPAACVGAPHRRQRLWFVADSIGQRHDRQHVLLRSEEGQPRASAVLEVAGRSQARVAQGDADNAGLEGRALPECKRQDQRPAWTPSILINCSDGKLRPTEPELFPLAHGVSNRMGKLRGYGNAIVPQVAAEVIAAFMDYELAELL
jgi:DNA (cytosine-5)-methyltransferase 1